MSVQITVTIKSDRGEVSLVCDNRTQLAETTTKATQAFLSITTPKEQRR